MRYLTWAADYTGSCISDDFEGQINYSKLQLDDGFCKQLDQWTAAYKIYIPMEMEERKKYLGEIEGLDIKGIQLAGELAIQVKGGAKVKYYSEGKLKYLGQDTN